MKKWWNKKTKSQKKWFLITLISTIVFLSIAFVCGVFVLEAKNISLLDFIQDPTFILIVLILLTLGVSAISYKASRRG